MSQFYILVLLRSLIPSNHETILIFTHTFSSIPSCILLLHPARKFETMRRSTRNRTPEQIDVLRTYRVSSANDNNDNRNTETDNTNTNSDRRGQQDRPVDADRVHNNNSPARQNNQYQPQRGNYLYRGIDRHVHTDRGHNNNSSARQNNQYQPRRGNYSYRGNNRRDT